MKGYTSIPYAREAAELIERPRPYVVDFSDKDLIFCMRVAHFEARYHTINRLLADLAIKNILELSSGFSFRGLDLISRNEIHFIDTDLSEVIEKKKELIDELTAGAPSKPGKLELVPVNALNKEQLIETVGRFSTGPVIIVNEGLLIYLGPEEKKSLCSSIRQILLEHGGYWITADVYKKNDAIAQNFRREDKLQELFDQHRIEENKFESFEQAEEFFRVNGLIVDKEAEPDYSSLPVMQKVMERVTPEQIAQLMGSGKLHTTWRLKVS
jgi:O-methyltransferase involved in polyketide biosynthesis